MGPLVAKGTCSKVGCTAAETEICLLSNPLPQCPNFRASSNAELTQAKAVEISVPEERPKASIPTRGARRFHLGLELGSEDAAEIGRARYCHLIGVLGQHNAGKTCFLLSLYLMASRGALPAGHIFAGARLLKGF